uniref:four and a half LIM domains protein 1-like n=1 Tax=Solea senegalensis TaxID=28829 RepID=UPI001CD866F4|nr:four and a half LIM domains protein 1-like [Solea senegalensis]XP_043872434.1 four and a half LIM domains protein 1-like [Solea senegalensis]XP_043872437.1 four and a half LIM domains protein 1-like [Solea senegalensis]XP_043872438.1 four and a half LIM domains protein 1-like [Solea senegalensis]
MTLIYNVLIAFASLCLLIFPQSSYCGKESVEYKGNCHYNESFTLFNCTNGSQSVVSEERYLYCYNKMLAKYCVCEQTKSHGRVKCKDNSHRLVCNNCSRSLGGLSFSCVDCYKKKCSG